VVYNQPQPDNPDNKVRQISKLQFWHAECLYPGGVGIQKKEKRK